MCICVCRLFSVWLFLFPLLFSFAVFPCSSNGLAGTCNSAARLRLDHVLSELASLSALCMRIHRKFKRAASRRIRRSSCLLLLLQSSSFASSKSSQGISQKKTSPETRKISNEDLGREESLKSQRGRVLLEASREKKGSKKTTTSSSPSLVDLIRQCPVCTYTSYDGASTFRHV